MDDGRRAASGFAHALPVWVWIAVIFCASSIPGPALQRVGLGVQDKILHAIEYGVLGFLAYRQQRGQIGRTIVGAIVVAWVIAMVVGCVDELYQSMIPGRDRDWLDWVADQSGGLAGAVIGAVYLHFASRRPERLGAAEGSDER